MERGREAKRRERSVEGGKEKLHSSRDGGERNSVYEILHVKMNDMSVYKDILRKRQ
jgi:hypothetical protein